MKYRALLGVTIAFTGFAAPAAAQSVRDGYGGRADVLGEVGEVEEAPASGTAPAPTATPAAAAAPVQQPTSAGETLPFTGSDAVLVLLGGLTLVGSGLVLRRLARDGA